MAKFYGNIGFARVSETAPGVWTEEIVEHPYYGEMEKHSFKWQGGQNINDNINFDMSINLIGDTYLYENLGFIRYVNWMHNSWKVSNVSVKDYPRLTLTLGGLYNGNKARDTENA